MKFTVHGGTKIQIFSVFSSVGSLKLLLFFFHTFMLPIGEANVTYRTELTFWYLIVSIRYSKYQHWYRYFKISDIGSVFFWEYRPMTTGNQSSI